MNHQYVSSSRIRSVGWSNNTLEVKFLDGVVYQYYGVSESGHRSFMNSHSLGSALSRIERMHPYNRV